ncbi:hypothetical protein [Acidovorax lacteus]|uniref:Uncharacterized protein n=1 Tax=Acidovorax lacteus TaxID=1924988 RepID=A0ABP8L966_9BURK
MTTNKTTATFWAQERRDELLRKHYATMATRELASTLGCTVEQARRRAYKLGLQKRPDALSHARSAEQRRARAAQEARARQAVANPGPRTHNNASARGDYDGAELQPTAGATPARLRAFSLPSRVGNKLYYPGGRVEHLS